MFRNVARNVGWMSLGLALACGLGANLSLPPSARAVAKDEAPGEPGAALKKFMREKLSAAQRSLEGLCVEDYDLIAGSADKLASMSRAAEWQVIPGPEYAQLSGEFRRAIDQLRKGAKDKDLDACRLAYLKATMSCLECHDFVRSTRLAALPSDLNVATAGTVAAKRPLPGVPRHGTISVPTPSFE